MNPKSFYGRPKVRLVDLRAIRTEMGYAYRACVRKELDWNDFRAAIYGLSAIARIDEGSILEQRVDELERQLLPDKPRPPNGHASGNGEIKRPSWQ